jgi:beta-1,4-mannosyl-glycoprotein beta-1,4-N-acetylglucosaminyltransferase
LQISIKLKTFAHSEYAAEKFSNINIIKNNIKNMKDLFGRNQLYKKVRLDNTFPKYLLDNKLSFKKWIL